MKKIVLKLALTAVALVGFSCTYAETCAKYNKNAEKIFGYNPQITGIPEKNSGNKVALLVLHGFGASEGKMYKKDFAGNSYYFPVFFNFKDTLFFRERMPNEGSSQASVRQIRGARSINIGQTPDTEVALYVLIKLWLSGYDVAIYGHSRGGAVAIKIADMLTNPDKYANSWKKLGVTKKIVVRGSLWNSTKTVLDKEKIERIKKSVKKTIFADKPLLDIKDILPKMVESSLALGTQHSTSEQQPIEILEKLKKDKGFNFHFTLASPYDDVVGNKSDKKLKTIAAEAKWTVVKVNEKHNDVKASSKIIEKYLVQKITQINRTKKLRKMMQKNKNNNEPTMSKIIAALVMKKMTQNR